MPWPHTDGLALALRVVVVDAWLTVWVSALLRLGAYVPSPL